MAGQVRNDWHRDRASGAISMVNDSMIAVSNVQPGPAPIVITCDVVIGGVLVHGVTLRRGRGLATYINMPASHRDGRWRPIVEITDPALLDRVRQAIITSALEVTRFNAS